LSYYLFVDFGIFLWYNNDSFECGGYMKLRHLIAYMETAKVWAKCSYAQRLQVGAVAVKDGGIIGTGFNGTPSGMDNCCEDEDGNTKPIVTHAEPNCLNKILRSNNSSVGAIMFITHSPCLSCATKMVDAGIECVIYDEPYRNIDGIEWLLYNNVRVFNFKEAMGRCDEI